MSIGKVCNDKTVTIPDTASVMEATKLMEKHNIGCLVVVNSTGKQPIGVLTDRDIVLALAKHNDVKYLTVKNLMSKDLLLIKDDEGIKTALDAMCKKGVRRAPIVDKDNELCGIATIDDLMFVLADEFKVASTLIRNQVTTSRH